VRQVRRRLVLLPQLNSNPLLDFAVRRRHPGRGHWTMIESRGHCNSRFDAVIRGNPLGGGTFPEPFFLPVVVPAIPAGWNQAGGLRVAAALIAVGIPMPIGLYLTASGHT
jgi:hypothetical protein